jgi:hypothetical protein
MATDDKYYESFEYWFKSPELHADVCNYDENYYAYKIYENILPLYDIPSAGFIVVLGTHNCLSFNLLCEKYGEERCIGFDLYNPSSHPKVIIKNCNELCDKDNMPIAFCHNDVGSYPTTPELKIHAQRWAAKNIIEGGLLLGRNNLNRAKFKNEEFMENLNFENFQFSDMQHEYSDLFKDLDFKCIEGHMLSRKIANNKNKVE